jgi:hypothetical protein
MWPARLIVVQRYRSKPTNIKYLCFIKNGFGKIKTDPILFYQKKALIF